MTGREKRQAVYRSVHWLIVNVADLALAMPLIVIWAWLLDSGLSLIDGIALGVLAGIFWLGLHAVALIVSLFIDD